MDKLNIAIIEGTTRPKRQSIKVANFLKEILSSYDDVETFVVDPTQFNLPFDGNDPENKDPKYTEITAKADAFIIVSPEYNHGYPGSLKRLLDSELKNYIHKPVNLVGVSDGPWGGVRVIEALTPVVRDLGMIATYADLQFPKVPELFEENGKIIDEKFIERAHKSFKELIWMAKVMKWGRENMK